MSIRISHLATGILVVAAMLLMSGRSWATYYGLGPSPDEWKLKYDVQANPGDGDKLTVVFSVADEGRLKPIHSVEVVAFNPQVDAQGGRSYDVKAPIKLQSTPDGRRAGQVQIPKAFADRAIIRIFTFTVDGRPQTAGAAYYDVPLKKYLHGAPMAAAPAPDSPPMPPPLAAPRPLRVTK